MCPLHVGLALHGVGCAWAADALTLCCWKRRGVGCCIRRGRSERRSEKSEENTRNRTTAPYSVPGLKYDCIVSYAGTYRPEECMQRSAGRADAGQTQGDRGWLRVAAASGETETCSKRRKQEQKRPKKAETTLKHARVDARRARKTTTPQHENISTFVESGTWSLVIHETGQSCLRSLCALQDGGRCSTKSRAITSMEMYAPLIWINMKVVQNTP